MENSRFDVDSNLFDSVKFEGDGMVTLHGLEKWTTHMYETLGWATLANRHNNSEKVVSYLNSIPRLMQALQSRMEGSSQSEKKDLEALARKVEHLHSVCDKLFNYQKLSDKLCEKCKTKVTDIVPFHLDSELSAIMHHGGAKKSKKTSKKTSKKGSKLTGGAKKSSKKKSKKTSKKGSKKSSKKTSKKSKK
jgi:hypothetical protein